MLHDNDNPNDRQKAKNRAGWMLFAGILVLVGISLVLSAAYGFISAAISTTDLYMRAKALVFAGGICLGVSAFTLHGIK